MIKESLTRETAKLADWPAERTESLAKQLHDYLTAFESGDFDVFWRFRVPTGMCVMTDDSRVRLRSFIENIQKDVGARLITEDELLAATAPQKMMELTWRAMDYPLEYKGITIRGCKSCFEAVALDSIRVSAIPTREPTHNQLQSQLLSHIRKYPRRGLHLQVGFVEVLPKLSDTWQKNPKETHLVSAMMPIRLRSGETLSVFLFSYWSDEKSMFLPFAHGMGDSSNYAPRILF